MFKIVVTMVTLTGQPIESYNFQAPLFRNEAACRAGLASDYFKVKLADLQLRLENAVAVGDNVPRGAKLMAVCVPV
jgi:hypothetical protein